MKKVLIVFYSEKGSTQKMAIEISNGVNSISGVEAVIRTVPVKEEEENNIANENDFIYLPSLTQRMRPKQTARA